MRILLDTVNIDLSRGAGITTYCRSLRQINNECGNQIDLLYGFVGGRSRDAVLNEVAFFDQRSGTGSRALDRTLLVAHALTTALGVTRPIPAHRVDIAGFVHDPPAAYRAAQHDRILTAPMLYRLAEYYFAITRRFLPVGADDPPSIAHWTTPLPLYMPGARNVYTVHDIIPLKLPRTTGQSRKRFRKLIDGVVRHADQIITISDTTTRDLVALAPPAHDKITNTFQAVSLPAHLLSRPTADNAALVNSLLGLLHREYFVFVSAIEPKKNVARLIAAFQASNAPYPLLIIGRRAFQADDELQPLVVDDARAALSRSAATPKRIVLLDHLRLEMLIPVIRSARALLFPSLYEGFGLPILEAMICGTPVMTSKYGAMAEIAAPGTALLIDPYDVQDMAGAINRLSGDEDLCRDLQAAGLARARLFSWETYKTRLQGAYRRAMDGGADASWR